MCVISYLKTNKVFFHNDLNALLVKNKTKTHTTNMAEDTLLTCWAGLNGVELEIAWLP